MIRTTPVKSFVGNQSKINFFLLCVCVIALNLLTTRYSFCLLSLPLFLPIEKSVCCGFVIENPTPDVGSARFSSNASCGFVIENPDPEIGSSRFSSDASSSAFFSISREFIISYF